MPPKSYAPTSSSTATKRAASPGVSTTNSTTARRPATTSTFSSSNNTTTAKRPATPTATKKVMASPAATTTTSSSSTRTTTATTARAPTPPATNTRPKSTSTPTTVAAATPTGKKSAVSPARNKPSSSPTPTGTKSATSPRPSSKSPAKGAASRSPTNRNGSSPPPPKPSAKAATSSARTSSQQPKSSSTATNNNNNNNKDSSQLSTAMAVSPPTPPAPPKKPEPGKLSTDIKLMSSDIHELNVEIAEVEEQIRDKDKMRNDRERYLDYDQDPEFDFILPPLEDCLAQAAEAELLLIGAQEELKMAEKSKAITLPQFEVVGKNKDAAMAKTAQYKREIDEAELLLEKSEAEIKRLEKSLAHASNVYKAERERRALFVDKLETELEELRKCVELSVVSMLPIDDDPSIPPGLETLRLISFLTSFREEQLATCHKLEREVVASTQLQQQRAIDIKHQKEEDEKKMNEMREAQLSAVRKSIWSARSDLERTQDGLHQQITEGRAALRNPRVASDAPGGLGIPTRKGAEKREGATLHSELVKQEAVDFQKERMKLMKELNEISVKVTNWTAKKEELAIKRHEMMQKSEARRAQKQDEVRAVRDQTAALEEENESLRNAIQAMKAHAEAKKRFDQQQKQQQQNLLVQQQLQLQQRLVPSPPTTPQQQQQQNSQSSSSPAVSQQQQQHNSPSPSQFSSSSPSHRVDLKNQALVSVRSKLMDDEIRQILRNFAAFDKNKDGVLDTNELISCVSSVLQGNFSSQENLNKLISDFILAADADGDGKLNIQEIRVAFSVDEREASPPPETLKEKQQKQTPLQRVRARLMDDELKKILVNFAKYDKNGDGVLDEAELTQAVKSVIGNSMSSEQAVEKLVQDLLAAADSDKDGKLSVDEIRTTFAVEDTSALSVSRDVSLRQSSQQQQTGTLKSAKTPLEAVKARLMDDELKKIIANFAKFDKNNDNALDETELDAAVRDAVGGNFSSDEAIQQLVKDLIAAADSDKDGKLTIAEMKSTFLIDERKGQTPPLSATELNAKKTPLQRVRAKLMDDEIRKIMLNFVKFDKNGDGLLDEHELNALLTSVLEGNFSSASAVDELVEDIITAADVDKDGKLSIKEIQTTFAFDERGNSVVGTPTTTTTTANSASVSNNAAAASTTNSHVSPVPQNFKRSAAANAASPSPIPLHQSTTKKSTSPVKHQQPRASSSSSTSTTKPKSSALPESKTSQEVKTSSK